jgi:NodT family efflux transporter outer membrane factor (OMF) lipoprotein
MATCLRRFHERNLLARRLKLVAAVCAILFVSGCAVGPRYSRAPASVPDAYKEAPTNWRPAQPADEMQRGKWWEIFHDTELNRLEEQINVSNQNLKVAQAQFQQARALVRFNRANYYPTVTTGLAVTENRISSNRPLRAVSGGKSAYTDITFPVDVSYEADLWGRIRKSVEAAREDAQASAADVENVSLSLHAELAVDYFEARSFDAEEELLNSTVAAFQQALQLTQNRYQGGVASGVDVAQAETQLETTRAEAIDLQVQRAQFEHAIAVLVGQPASTFNLAPVPLTSPPPIIPPGLPSELLERRPDVAGAERRMAAANARIGVARAAYFPTIQLSGSGGFESTSITTLLSGPSGLLAAGISATVTAFDVGRRRAINEQARAVYDQTVANYRETVLQAFQEVEDNLAALRILEAEAATQQSAVAASQRSLELSNNRYKGGVVTYLEVLTAQSTALSNQRVAVDILRRRMAASVLLVKALGGGWSAGQLPTDLLSSTSKAGTATPDASQVRVEPNRSVSARE